MRDSDVRTQDADMKAESSGSTPEQGIGIRIRRGSVEDADDLYELSLRAIRQSATEHYSEQQLAAWSRRRTVEGHRRMLRSTCTFVAVAGDVTVGFTNVALAEMPGLQPGEVDQLFVHPGYGGQGIAARLVKAVTDVAEAHAIRGLVAHVSWRAVPVFEGAGFRRVQVESVDVDGEVLTGVLMRKDSHVDD